VKDEVKMLKSVMYFLVLTTPNDMQDK